jgi:ankyrin repeat protein
MTALHVAAQTGKLDIVRYLLDKGARTDIADSEGRKPMDLVATGAKPAGEGAAAATAEIRMLLESAGSRR